MNPGNPNRQYYPALDGLRGLAILLVVVFHNFWFVNYFFYGWLGVDLFFVLSGFLITDILLRTLTRKNFLSNFYIRRVLRIFPLYYLFLFLFLVVLPRLDLQLNVKYYLDNQVWIWTFMQNWLYAFKDPVNTNTLNHLWSLGAEEQFYLLWPLVILLVRKPRGLLLFISLVIVTVIGLRVFVWTRHIPGFAYFNLYTFTRVDGICIGCMIAILQRIDKDVLRKYTWIIVLSFALMNFAFYLFDKRFFFSVPYLAIIGYPTFAMLFGLLVNEAITKTSKLVNYIFTIPVLTFFGRISYGFYIFHWPVYIVLYPFVFPWLTHYFKEISAQYIEAILSTGVAVVVSWISYRYYERFFLNLKNRFA